MAKVCDCTQPTALSTVSATVSRCNPAKIGKLIFQRNLTSNNFDGDTPTNPIQEKTSWTTPPLADAVDDTKVIVTPRVENAEFSEPDILSDGENLDGAAINEDSSPTIFNCQIRNLSYEQQTALRDLMCEPNLAVYFIDGNGSFLAKVVSTATPDTYNGFTISDNTLVVSDPSKGSALENKFMTMITFSLASGWANDKDLINPEAGFYPLVDIVPS